jgi:hypothetical protein
MLFCGEHPRTSPAVFFSMMWGLGAGGVFTRCFGLRPREGPMAGPLGNAARRVCVGGRNGKEEGGGRMGTRGEDIRVRGFILFYSAKI